MASMSRTAGGTGQGARMREMWTRVAPAWERRAAHLDVRAAPLTERLLEVAGVAPGDHVLELACGPGGLGLAAARRVGPEGRVVLSDVSPAMTAIAARRAAEAGLGHVRTRPLDLEAVDEPDGAYDVVLCREGLMFAGDPGAALGEIRRVLRPGGRFALSVWGPPERNPWLACALHAFAEVTGVTVPPPGVPGPFSLGDPDRLRGLVAAAALGDRAVEEVEVPTVAPTAEAWWEQVTVLAGPLAGRLAALPEEVRDAVRARAVASVTERAEVTGAGIRVPGVALLAGGPIPG